MSGVHAAVVVGAAVWVIAAGSLLVLGRSASGAAVGVWRWIAWSLVVTATAAAAGLVSSLLVDRPAHRGAGFAVAVVAVPLAVALGRSARSALVADRALVAALVAGGLVALVGVVYVLVVLGLGHAPERGERSLLALSMAAAALTGLLALPAHRRLDEWASQLVYGERHSPDEALATFGGRMSRAVPMDELLLQLVEILKKTMRLRSAEIWTGSDGVLALSVSVPDAPARQLRLGPEELPVVARAHAQGNAWMQMWAPDLLSGREQSVVRSVSVTHLGELLGLIVVERGPDEAPFAEAEDRALVDLARQVGLALHNVRLDSALQASLDELRVRNEELVASRARIVAAADDSRRRIERNLHDGAQQHLVALAVKVGLIRTLLGSKPEQAATMIDELREDVQATLTELRELAHGIYPPLLRDRGLPEALQTAANRAVLPTEVVAGALGRYGPEIEAAVYFCCLEAMQNAGKHAGDGSVVTVEVDADDASLWFEVRDDGAGFVVDGTPTGHGFVNMADRLGAVGGALEVRSGIGAGTVVRGRIPTP